MVQSFPSPTSTITMLQTRPSSEAFQNASQGQQHQRASQMPMNIYNTSVGGMAAGSYRGHTSTSPASPYAFTSPAILPSGSNPLRQHPTSIPPPRLENRTVSAPSVPLVQQSSQQISGSSSRPRPPTTNTVSTPLSLSGNSSRQQTFPNNNASTMNSTPQQGPSRPLSTADLNLPAMPTASYATVAKSSPDRYRRNHRRAETSGGLTTSSQAQGGSAMPSGSGMATVGHLYQHPTQTSSTPSLTSYPSYRGTQPTSSTLTSDPNPGAKPRLTSKDDLNLQRERQASSDLAKRYRRRSISSMEAKDFVVPLPEAGPGLTLVKGQPKTYAAMLAGPAPVTQERKEVRAPPAVERPTSSHERHVSNESSSSGRSSSKEPSVRYVTLSPYLVPSTRSSLT